MIKLRTLLTLGIGTLILSLVGFYNGYPLVYSDTGTYIYSGFDKFIPVDRTIAYGLFVKFFSFNSSTWHVILFQNLLTAFVLYEAIKLFNFKQTQIGQIYFSVLLFLVLLTGIGWYSNQLMPDFFTPLAILILFILLKKKNLTIVLGACLSLILIYSLISHFSHLLIASSLIIITLSFRLGNSKKLIEISFKRIAYVAVIVFLSWITLPGINYLIEKQFILSKGSHVFLMAHLNDTGILEQFLKENCSDPQYMDCKLCQYKDSLPTDVAAFLWGSNVLENTGGWLDSKEEYNKIIYATLKQPKYLFLNIFRSITYGLIQLTDNTIGAGLSAYNEGSAPYGQIHWRFHNELNNYLNSKQNEVNGFYLKLEALNVAHSIVIFISLFIMILLFTGSILSKIDDGAVIFLLFSIVAIIVNSFVTAGLSMPYDRYQCRVVWLLPFALVILIIRNYDIILKTISRKHS